MYDRQPSARYQEALDLHAHAHVNGLTRRNRDGQEQTHAGSDVFEGTELLTMVQEIQHAATSNRCKHLLDFGCGKAKGYYNEVKIDKYVYQSMYDVVGIDPASVFLYDPGVSEFMYPPRREQTFDLVVCTDVLEHIPEEDADMVLDYLFEKCNKAMVVSISCGPAFAILNDGRNAHVNVQKPEWWIAKFGARLEKKALSIHVSMMFTDPVDNVSKCQVFRSVKDD